MQREYPLLVDRFQSVFIDSLFVIGCMIGAGSLLDRFDEAPDWIRIALFFGIWALYEPLAVCLGGTIGNYMKGIRVRKQSNPDKRINFFQAFGRYIIKMSLGWISFLTVHFNPQKRAVHDLASGSVMVKVS
jgi:uncharacterized RDD family membrane protein YckC